MSEDPENLTIRLLQEMRREIAERFDAADRRLDAIDRRFTAMDEHLEGIEQRIDGNTLILNMLAGLIHDHEQRIDVIEARGS